MLDNIPFEWPEAKPRGPLSLEECKRNLLEWVCTLQDGTTEFVPAHPEVKQQWELDLARIYEDQECMMIYGKPCKK